MVGEEQYRSSLIHETAVSLHVIGGKRTDNARVRWLVSSTAAAIEVGSRSPHLCAGGSQASASGEMKTLRQVLPQGDTVLFIGSGISRWAGLPSWPQLIEELTLFLEASDLDADLVRAEAKRGDLLQAARCSTCRAE